MAAGRLKWDQQGERTFETGIQNMILFPMNDDGSYGAGVAWDGVTSFAENPSGAEATEQYADNTVYAVLMSLEKFGATLEAFKSPVEFDACDGTAAIGKGVSVSQQTRRGFALAYRTEIGNDVTDAFGYKWHIVYGCKAQPSSRTHQTINESPEMDKLSWEIKSTPIAVPGMKNTSKVTINSLVVDDDDKMTAFEDILLGKDAAGDDPAVASRLPLPAELKTLFPTVG